MHGDYNGVQQPFAVMSKGLGLSYVKRMKDYHKATLASEYTVLGGQKISLPRYFKDKIFTDAEKITIGYRNRKIAQTLEDQREADICSKFEDPMLECHVRKNAYIERRMLQLKKSSKI